MFKLEKKYIFKFAFSMDFALELISPTFGANFIKIYDFFCIIDEYLADSDLKIKKNRY